MHRVRVVIQGRVQGVGFRHFVMRRARALGLTGWVCNRGNGDVELEAEGTRVALADLLQTLRAGPPAARVSHLDEQWGEGEPRYRNFEVTG